ncbi:sensor histidine kinase [uncultured Tateyamaria sp.]|uniref:sensor histidine kinase n=1 Tax=uncultured Tateyamaria sp. TaxID=455651 RepID=UPI0026127A71|nr:sensor histidine kinase [uncultured Tateyamaria sp.]
MKAQSLRTRLIVIILTPLLLLSVLAASWQFRNATHRAEEIFDRDLLSAALAISRDVALSGGDALSPPTRRLISDTSGGELFYHVYAPDGVFVTGYATPPPPPDSVASDSPDPQYYEAIYQGSDVRVLRFRDATTIDGVSGLFTITVWQNLQVRGAFVRDVATRAVSVIAALLVSLALIVWFGVGLGLRPLLDLQDAIAKRTPNDLTPIRRDVPLEARGIVSTLNALLERISRRISSKDEFISNAAHQLRNPIAGVLALAEAVESAPSPKAAKSRSAELVKAARAATHLTNQMLSFERARGADVAQTGAQIDLCALVSGVITRFHDLEIAASTDVTADLPTQPVLVWGDEVMLQEALLNLLTNAVVHGGPDLSRIVVSLAPANAQNELRIEDNGKGINPDERELVLGRFAQADAGAGSGLGLPIAASVIDNHGGSLRIGDKPDGAQIVITLPRLTQRTG